VHTPALGTLDWQPALDRPDLLAAPVASALAAAGPGWYAAPIDPDLADTAAFCATYGVPLEASANCVVVAGRRADTTTLAACVVLATDRADVNKTVRRHLDVRKISFAPMAEAVERSGMEHGGITPVGLPADWPLLVDRAVVDAGWVVVGSGTRNGKLAVRGEDLARWPGAEVLALTVSAAG
jgi:prolyl-tRNA editing enzyme YbaK/EbsC (Cys-tRNA(Pro) deacylase)